MDAIRTFCLREEHLKIFKHMGMAPGFLESLILIE